MGLGNGRSFVRSQYGMYHVGKFCLFVTTVIGSYYILFLPSCCFIYQMGELLCWLLWQFVSCVTRWDGFSDQGALCSIASGILTSLRALEFDMK